MKTFRKNLLLLLGLAGGFVASISTASAVDKEKGGKFTPPALEQIESKQTSEGVSIGVVPFNNEMQAKTAFGKLHPYEYGVLPVLVVMRNDSKNTINLANMKLQYVAPSGGNVDAIPASEVKYTRAPSRPNFNPSPIPGIRRKPKNPLDNQIIEERAFAAKMLPPGESATGFVYFQTGHRPGSRFYVTGLQEAGSGKELFYFDIQFER